MEQNDVLDDCIIQIFGEEEELENTEITIHDDHTNIPAQEERDDENDNANMSGTNDDNVNATEGRNTPSFVPKISLGNVFLLGRQIMIEIKIPLVREKKKARINRPRAFF